MKYIRTKDGIYESKKVLLSIPPMHSKHIDIKTADTIEELCDEFVLITDDEEINKRDCVRLKKHTFMRGQKGLSFSITERDKKENGYYGAIWTDKGLIYVAKMNDKGELELL